ncbi:hypothetical protein [Geminicoccus roseus]|uniref:hypothetical protein n=1 Tax=Geminicoccus roseus TaxID=404900 RepID=UPI0003FA6D1D|nr:hypothetical protein [Geminicoccus roseus]
MSVAGHDSARAPAPPPPGRRHEQSDVAPRNVLVVTGLLLAGILAAILLVGGLFVLLQAVKRPPAHTALEAVDLVPPAPRLEVSPAGDRQAIEAAAGRLLEGYAWTDRAQGRVRIPIERAMEMVARQGWPDLEARP